MATMQDVVSYIVNRGGKVQNVDSNSFSINYPFSNGRDQLLTGFLNTELQLLTVTSPFAKKSQVSAERVLELGVLFGVIAMGEFYWLTTTVPLATIDELEVEVILSGMVFIADTYEQKLTGGNNF